MLPLFLPVSLLLLLSYFNVQFSFSERSFCSSRRPWSRSMTKKPRKEIYAHSQRGRYELPSRTWSTCVPTDRYSVTCSPLVTKPMLLLTHERRSLRIARSFHWKNLIIVQRSFHRLASPTNRLFLSTIAMRKFLCDRSCRIKFCLRSFYYAHD